MALHHAVIVCIASMIFNFIEFSIQDEVQFKKEWLII